MERQLLECLPEWLALRFEYLARRIAGCNVLHVSGLDPPQSLFPTYGTYGRSNGPIPERHFEPLSLRIGVIFFKPYPVISNSYCHKL